MLRRATGCRVASIAAGSIAAIWAVAALAQHPAPAGPQLPQQFPNTQSLPQPVLQPSVPPPPGVLPPPAWRVAPMAPIPSQYGPKLVLDASIAGAERGTLERDAKLYVDKLQKEQKADSQSKLAVIELKPNGAGYLVTREYDDFSAVFPDGRPKYRWSITSWVAAEVISPRPVTPVTPQPPVTTVTPPPVTTVTPPPATPPKVERNISNRPVPAEARPARSEPTRTEPTRTEPALVAVEGTAFDKRNGREVLLPISAEALRPLPIAQLWPPQGPGQPLPYTPEQMQKISDSFGGTVIVDQLDPATQKRLNDAAYATAATLVNAGVYTGTIYVSVQFPMVGLAISGGQGFYTAYDNAKKRGATGSDAVNDGLAGAGVGVVVSMVGGKIAGYYGGMVASELARKGISAGGEVVGGALTNAMLDPVRDPGYTAPDAEKALQMVNDPLYDRSLQPEESGGVRLYR